MNSERWEEFCEKARAQGNHYEDRLVAAGLMACDRIDDLEAEVVRLKEALEVVRGEIDHMFHSVEPFTPGWLARIRNAARKALGDA